MRAHDADVASTIATATNGTLAHTLAHISRFDLLLRREVLRFRQQPQLEGPELRGLYVSEASIDAFLASSPRAGSPAPDPLTLAEATVLEAAVAAAEARLADLERSGEGRDRLGLAHLTDRFRLSAFERDVIIVALAAEIDLRYERVFAYLQDDVTKKRPTVDLALRLLGSTSTDHLAARQAFTPSAPLLRWQLINLVEEPGARHPVLPARSLKIDDRIADFLVGVNTIDSRLSALAAGIPADDGLTAGVRDRLTQWAARWTDAGFLILLHGSYGTGRRAAAGFLANAFGRPCLLLDMNRRAGGDAELRQILRLAEREALLTGALLCLCHVEHLLLPDASREAEAAVFVDALARSRTPTVLIGERLWEPARGLDGRTFYSFEMPETTYGERRLRWAAALQHVDAPLDDRDINALAGRFRLTAGQIQDAILRARTLARTRDPLHGRLTCEDIDAACRTQSQHRLDTLARKLTPRYSWNDIVLAPQELNTLRLITSMIRQRAVVYGEWGFDRKLAMGKGVMALFAGPSGTGKTMAAEIIARDLGLDLYKIDLSAVVNKYVGETEKNLERMFQEAKHSDAILFFDEADALFGRRSSVSDAHDRYANIETAYLLQRTEEYDGLVILASNLPKNVDEAFLRRLHFSVSFREPDEAERLQIWRQMFPPEAPLANDIDLESLARRVKLTGGHLRNIGLASAFLAADEGQPIAMRHLMVATGYELQKIGKMRLESDKGPEARRAGR
jgi:AAA+ superfamily predicted ATPase